MFVGFVVRVESNLRNGVNNHTCQLWNTNWLSWIDSKVKYHLFGSFYFSTCFIKNIFVDLLCVNKFFVSCDLVLINDFNSPCMSICGAFLCL